LRSLRTKRERIAQMLMARSLSAQSGSMGELQTFEEGEQGVRCPVAAGVAVGGVMRSRVAV
jgi:hypothetical protein